MTSPAVPSDEWPSDEWPSEERASERRPKLLVLNITSDELAQSMARRLGSAAGDRPVVWSDGDSEVTAFPGKLRLALLPGLLLVELPMATDQTGPARLVVSYSLGKSPADAALVALTEEIPRGNELLASRWGHLVQEVLWKALLAAGEEELRERSVDSDLAVAGVFCGRRRISFIVTQRISAREIGDYFVSRETEQEPEVRREKERPPERVPARAVLEPLSPPELTPLRKRRGRRPTAARPSRVPAAASLLSESIRSESLRPLQPKPLRSEPPRRPQPEPSRSESPSGQPEPSSAARPTSGGSRSES